MRSNETSKWVSERQTERERERERKVGEREEKGSTWNFVCALFLPILTTEKKIWV